VLRQEGYRELEVKSEEIKQSLLKAEDVMSQCRDEHVSQLRSRFQRLSQQLLDVRAKADKCKVLRLADFLPPDAV